MNREVIELTLPWPPSVNTYYRCVNGRAVKSAKARKYRGLVADAVLVAGCPKMPLAEELELEIKLFPPNKRRIDTDNRIKAVQDALQGAGVFEDDWLIGKVVCERKWPIKSGICVVTIKARENG